MNRRKTKASNQEQIRGALVQVAHLYYDENLSQQEIADRLGMSRSLIAQYLQRSREAGIVRIEIIDPDEACVDLAQALTRETGGKHVTVIPNPRGPEMLALRAVAGAAAGFITNQLKSGDTFGLAWGRTTSTVVELLKPPRVHNLDVFPMLGETSYSGLHSQMNQLVMLAAEKLQAKAHFLSLPMVLSSSALRDALLNEAGIRDVIKRWDRINLACVGIGTVPPLPGMTVYIGSEHLPRLVEAGAVGDICGIYFDQDGKIVKNGLEDQIIGVDILQMRKIRCLVAVGCGEGKARAILGAMRSGLLSALFVDQIAAEYILAIIHSTTTGKSKGQDGAAGIS